jgi:hypothetical protein
MTKIPTPALVLLTIADLVERYKRGVTVLDIAIELEVGTGCLEHGMTRLIRNGTIIRDCTEYPGSTRYVLANSPSDKEKKKRRK